MSPAQEPLDLTIILPTRNEAANVAPLVKAIGAALAGGRWRYELLFVDDSTDEDPGRNPETGWRNARSRSG